MGVPRVRSGKPLAPQRSRSQEQKLAHVTFEHETSSVALLVQVVKSDVVRHSKRTSLGATALLNSDNGTPSKICHYRGVARAVAGTRFADFGPLSEIQRQTLCTRRAAHPRHAAPREVGMRSGPRKCRGSVRRLICYSCAAVSQR